MSLHKGHRPVLRFFGPPKKELGALNLTEIPSGRRVRIERIPDSRVRNYLLRLGILEGSVIRCVQRLGKGPVVIRRNDLELSLGHRLAKGIVVTEVGEER